MPLSQTGTDKNPLQNRIPGITHTLRHKISAYCVKTLKKPVNLNFKSRIMKSGFLISIRFKL
jgi:hypothetical protein